MNINGLFETIDQYLGYLESANDSEQISGLIDSLNFLFQFLFMFLFGGN